MSELFKLKAENEELRRGQQQREEDPDEDG